MPLGDNYSFLLILVHFIFAFMLNHIDTTNPISIVVLDMSVMFISSQEGDNTIL